MPHIQFEVLRDMAIQQNHFQNDHFTPATNYPTGSFYATPTMPNVTWVSGHLHVLPGIEIYGIVIVDGEVQFDTGSMLRGVLISISDSNVFLGGSPTGAANIDGALISWAGIIGADGAAINFNPTYTDIFYQEFMKTQLPIQVIY